MTSKNWMPVCALLCMALFANFVLVPGHDPQRLLEIATLLCCAAWLLLARPALIGGLFEGTTGKLIGTFFMLGLLSSLQAHEPQLAFYEVSVFALLYAAARSGGAEIAQRGVPTLVRLLQIIGVAGAIYVIKFLAAYFGSFYLGYALQADDFTPGFSNIRFFNHIQTSTLPLLVLLCCLTPATSRLRWLWQGVTAYWWLALFATTGRGTLVGIIAAAAVVGFFLRGAAMPYLRQLGLTALLGLAAYFVLLALVPMLLGVDGFGAFSSALARTASDPASGRMRLWKLAAGLVLEHPLLGVGPMHFAHYGRPAMIGAHPHDWVLQISSEWGIPALVSLLSAIAIAFFALVRAARSVAESDRDNRAAAAALIAGAVAILVDASVSGTLVMPQSQLGVALYLACAIGWYRSRVPAPLTNGTRTAARIGGALLVAAAMGGLVNVAPAGLARLRGEPLSPELQAVNTGDHWARLWMQGYF